MGDFDFPAVLESQQEGGFVVTFSDVPEAITQGEDGDEALLCVRWMRWKPLCRSTWERKPLPVPSAQQP